MSSLLERIGAFFLEPPADRAASPPAEPRCDPSDGAPTEVAKAPAPAGGRSRPLGFASFSAGRPAARSFAPPSAGGSEAAGFAPPSAGGPEAAGFAPPSAARSEAAGFAPPSAGGPEAAGFAPPSAGGPAAAGFAPPSSAARPADAGLAPPSEGGADGAGPAFTANGFAAVLGGPAEAVPVAAACAGELRANARATAAVLCVWGGGEPPAGATTPGVRRLAARLAAHGLVATASGRLAWVALDPSPPAAATQVTRARALADAPVVLAVAGPRPAAFELLLAQADLALVVLAAEVEQPLRALALATLPSRASLAVAPLPPGPPRWAAMAGLARMRSLKVPR